MLHGTCHQRRNRLPIQCLFLEAKHIAKLRVLLPVGAGDSVSDLDAASGCGRRARPYVDCGVDWWIHIIISLPTSGDPIHCLHDGITKVAVPAYAVVGKLFNHICCFLRGIDFVEEQSALARIEFRVSHCHDDRARGFLRVHGHRRPKLGSLTGCLTRAGDSGQQVGGTASSYIVEIHLPNAVEIRSADGKVVARAGHSLTKQAGFAARTVDGAFSSASGALAVVNLDLPCVTVELICTNIHRIAVTADNPTEIRSKRRPFRNDGWIDVVNQITKQTSQPPVILIGMSFVRAASIP